MLALPGTEKLIALRRALAPIPPALENENSYTGIAIYLEAQKVTPQLAQGVEFALTSAKIPMSVMKSSVDFAIRRKLGSGQSLCVAFSILAILISEATYLMAQAVGGVYVLFWGAVVAGITGAIHFSNEKKKYVGNEADFLKVEELCPPTVIDPSGDIY